VSGNDVALITGASAGLGLEFARQLSKRGRKLVLVARRQDRLDALAAELGNARTVALDLSDAGSTAALMANVAAAGEHIETLINNAGFGLRGRFVELDAARQRQMIDLNVTSLTELCRAVAPGMVEHGSGAILNVASTAAFQPGPNMAVYFATKSYVLSFSEALHEELKPHGIRVTALCPGPTKTEFGEVAGFGENSAFDRMAADAASVVSAGLKGMDRNRALVVPGLLNKVGASSTRFVPRPLVRKIAGALKF
jgi:short-subunit dehydrogenase